MAINPKPEYQRYQHFKHHIQDWLLGGTGLPSVAGILGVTPSSLEEMLNWSGCSDLNSHPLDGITDQDIMNAIFLSICRRSTIRHGIRE